MSQLPEQKTLPFATNPASEPGSEPRRVLEFHKNERAVGRTTQRIPRWLVRAELYLRVLLRVYFGLAILYMPWSGQVLTYLPWSRILWDQNPLFLHYPLLGQYAAMGAVRGVISGLGLLNLWFAFQDVIRHWDD